MSSLSSRGHWKRVAAVVALASFVPVSMSGCFGRFELTRKVYKFNSEVDPDKWVRWIVFLVLAIFPYGLATLIDALFANSVEFWTGQNPILADGDDTRTLVGQNGEYVSATRHADGSIDLLAVDADGKTYALHFVREGDSLAARDDDGRLLARVAEVNGQPQLVGGSGF